jgi:hypothetical protein
MYPHLRHYSVVIALTACGNGGEGGDAEAGETTLSCSVHYICSEWYWIHSIWIMRIASD